MPRPEPADLRHALNEEDSARAADFAEGHRAILARYALDPEDQQHLADAADFLTGLGASAPTRAVRERREWCKRLKTEDLGFRGATPARKPRPRRKAPPA